MEALAAFERRQLILRELRLLQAMAKEAAKRKEMARHGARSFSSDEPVLPVGLLAAEWDGVGGREPLPRPPSQAEQTNCTDSRNPTA
jgi:DNA-binding transcriptional regulator PaaX